jgi:hypothetical protein
LAGTLEDAAVRDRVVSCLASAPPSDVRDAALVRAGLVLEPTSAREVLAGLAHAETSSEAAIALAIGALDRAEAGLQPAALALEASRHVIRGGSFDAGVLNMRVRYRDSHPANGAGPHVSFRCAR